MNNDQAIEEIRRLVGQPPDASVSQIVFAVERLLHLAYPPEECPHCQADLTGPSIPQEERHLFGGALFFSRKVAIYDVRLDRTVGYKCPTCGGEW